MTDYDEVIDLDIPWLPDAAVSGAVLGQSEFGDTVLAFRVAPIAETDKSFAVLMFGHCLATKFGYPNDEARAGHPLWSRGLFQGQVRTFAYEVLRPSWLERVRQENAVSFPEPPGVPENDRWPNLRPILRRAGHEVTPFRHFVVAFKEATFECLGQKLEGYFTADPSDIFLSVWRGRGIAGLDKQ